MPLCHSRVTARLQSTEEPPELGTWPPFTSVSPRTAEFSIRLTYASKDIPGNPRPSTGRQTPSGGPSSTKLPSRPDTNSELEGPLAACKQSGNKDLYDLVVLALYTGMRQGELMAIRRSWIRLDMDSPGISLPAIATKGNEDRFVPLVGEALSSLV